MAWEVDEVARAGWLKEWSMEVDDSHASFDDLDSVATMGSDQVRGTESSRCLVGRAAKAPLDEVNCLHGIKPPSGLLAHF